MIMHAIRALIACFSCCVPRSVSPIAITYFYSQISVRVRVSAPSYRFVVVNTETSDISHGAVSSATPCHESLLN